MARRPEPRAELLATASVPPESTVPPEYVLAPDRVSVPEPTFCSWPEPEIVPERVSWFPVVSIVSVPVRPMALATLRPSTGAWSTVPFAIESVPPPSALLPVMAMVPEFSAVPPANILPPESVSVPPPACVRLPEPLMTPANVMLSLRLKTSWPLSVTLPVIEPVMPPLPICRVPLLICVAPV